jgi:hypothetical protein
VSAGQFAFDIDGVAATITNAVRSGATVTLTVSDTITSSDVLDELAYTPGTLTDVRGNPVAAFSGEVITNNISSFAPESLFAASEVGVWYDIHPDYCFTDTARTTNAAVGNLVAAVEDRSGNGNHAVQATSGNRPTLRQSGGLYYLEFDSFTDFMSFPSAPIYAAGAGTLFAGLRADAGSDNRIYAEGSSSSNNPIYALLQRRVSPDTDRFGVTIRNDASSMSFANTTDTGSPALNSSTVAVVTVQDTGSNISTRVNGSGSAGASYTRSGTLTVNQTAIGALLRISAGNFTNVDIYSLVVIGRTVTAGELEAGEAYMADKAGVTL